MNGRRRGGSGPGRRVTPARGAVTALLSVGICLLAAPAAYADPEDLLDTDLGTVSAAEVADIPGDPAVLDASGVLRDPLAQLAKPDDDDMVQDDSDPSSLKFPRLSLPSSGNGSGGNGSGGSGSHAGHGAKLKANASATKAHDGPPDIVGHG